MKIFLSRFIATGDLKKPLRANGGQGKKVVRLYDRSNLLTANGFRMLAALDIAAG